VWILKKINDVLPMKGPQPYISAAQRKLGDVETLDVDE
jgi:hypothetical protein